MISNSFIIKFISFSFLVNLLQPALLLIFKNIAILNYIDEFLLILCLLVVVVNLPFLKSVGRFSWEVIICLFLLLCISFYSVITSHADPFVVVLGYLDLVKFSLVLLIYALIENIKFRTSVLRSVLPCYKFAFFFLIIGFIIGILQEINANFIYLLYDASEFKELYRYGILRVPSIFGQSNAFAKVSIHLILISLIINRYKRLSIGIFIMVLVMTFSRGFILGILISLLGAFFIERRTVGKKIKIKVLTFAVLFIAVFAIVIARGALDERNEQLDAKLNEFPETYIRTAVFKTSINLLADHFSIGVGPGYFGGNVGKKFGIDKYFNEYQINYMVPFFDITGDYYIDTYWPQVWAEIGAVGFIVYMFLFFRINVLISKVRENNNRLLLRTLFIQSILLGFVSPIMNYAYYMVNIILIVFMILYIEKKNIILCSRHQVAFK